MTRFWMVQYVVMWVELLLATLLHWSWWSVALIVVGIFMIGMQFLRAARADDERGKGAVVLISGGRP